VVSVVEQNFEKGEQKMVDVLMLTAQDLSNIALRFAKCLRMLDLDVRGFKAISHMRYGDELELIKMERVSKMPYVFKTDSLLQLAKQSRVLHFTSGTFVDTGVDVTKKIVVMQYGGRPFVGRPKGRKIENKFLNRFVNYTIVHHPYLLNTGSINPCLIKPPIDTDLLLPDYERRNPNKVIIGHFPSDKEKKAVPIKGTEIIRKVLETLKRTDAKKKFEYIIETNRLPWEQHLQRLKKCDVVIECYTPMVMQDKFGEWSTATLESASLGKITVTNSFNENIYVRTYGPSEICIANNPNQMEKVLYNLINLSNAELQNKKVKTREWVVRCHSMEATAKLLWEKVYKHIFPERRPKLIYGKENES
jgi:hypothetical protein